MRVPVANELAPRWPKKLKHLSTRGDHPSRKRGRFLFFLQVWGELLSPPPYYLQPDPTLGTIRSPSCLPASFIVPFLHCCDPFHRCFGLVVKICFPFRSCSPFRLSTSAIPSDQSLILTRLIVLVPPRLPAVVGVEYGDYVNPGPMKLT